MKRIVIILLGLFIVCGCEEKNNLSNNAEDEEINVKEIMAQNDNVTILDVRTKAEYDEGHIAGALNIPYDEIDESIDIPKDEIVFVYCQSGHRSSIAYETLKGFGYEVYDLGAFASIDLPTE